MQVRSILSRAMLAAIAAAAGTSAANAAIIQYSATLDGASEAPPNTSAGVGTALLTYDNVAHTYRLEVTFSGLSGNITAAHIHGATANPRTGTAGVMTQLPSYPGFPSGVNAGTYDRTFDMTLSSSWSAAFLTARGGSTAAAETFFINAVADGKAYLNLHTSVVPAAKSVASSRRFPARVRWACSRRAAFWLHVVVVLEKVPVETLVARTDVSSPMNISPSRRAGRCLARQAIGHLPRPTKCSFRREGSEGHPGFEPPSWAAPSLWLAGG